MSTIKGRGFASAILAFGIASLFSAASAFSAAIVQESEGDVRAGATPALSKPVSPNQRVLSGTSLITSPGSRVTLRFDDGQVVALHENTEFRIAEFYYRPQEPTADRAVFVLLRGALRVVTGALGKRNRDAFALHLPQGTIGIRGTDFMVAIVNPAYLSVLKGTVAATNVAGTVAFEAETFGSIALQFPSWGWSVASGVLSVALGVILLMQWQTVSLWFIGFAVGRTVFWDALVNYRANKITRGAAVAQIAASYREWVDVFEKRTRPA